MVHQIRNLSIPRLLKDGRGQFCLKCCGIKIPEYGQFSKHQENILQYKNPVSFKDYFFLPCVLPFLIISFIFAFILDILRYTISCLPSGLDIIP
jgi:hypothetical protein